jgi:hypothetical protein
LCSSSLSLSFRLERQGKHEWIPRERDAVNFWIRSVINHSVRLLH